jgi:hypothetical protein
MPYFCIRSGASKSIPTLAMNAVDNHLSHKSIVSLDCALRSMMEAVRPAWTTHVKSTTRNALVFTVARCKR